MKITVVGMPSEQIHYFDGAEEMIAAAPSLGWTLKGVENQAHLLPHLLSLPTFVELCGPMGDSGKDNAQQARYETWPAYEMYSS